MRIEPAAPQTGAKNDPVKVAAAAQQFEALLIGQMLKTVADSASEGWMGSGGQSGSSAMEMAQEQFANALSANGGLGLTSMIVKSLAKPAVAGNAAPHPTVR